jgi:hypothetical protein
MESQEPTTKTYPDPDKPNPHPYILFISLEPILILFSHQSLGLSSCLFISGLMTEICMKLTSPPMRPAHSHRFDGQMMKLFIVRFDCSIHEDTNNPHDITELTFTPSVKQGISNDLKHR